jgi:hypothetical protein
MDAENDTRHQNAQPQPQPRAEAQAREAHFPERRGEVVRLLPVAVVVLSADRYFRAAATMLLTRRGCRVLSAADEQEALDAAELAALDVLVAELDVPAEELPARARALGARLDALGAAAGRRVAAVGIVLVGEPERIGEAIEADASASHPVLDKWGPFERLYQAICDQDRRRRLALPQDAARWPAGARSSRPA